jgi:PEP-CTERM motif
VAFVSADYFLPDNLGGISLLVSSVPEPASALLLLAGLGCVRAVRSRSSS